MVPINLGLLAIFIAGFTLERRWAMASVLLFLLMGAIRPAGVRRLQGRPPAPGGQHGGLSAGLSAVRRHCGGAGPWADTFIKRVFICALAVLACYTTGTLWLMWLTGRALPEVLGFAVIPFLPGDALKCIAAAMLAPRLAGLSRAR